MNIQLFTSKAVSKLEAIMSGIKNNTHEQIDCFKGNFYVFIPCFYTDDKNTSNNKNELAYKYIRSIEKRVATETVSYTNGIERFYLGTFSFYFYDLEDSNGNKNQDEMLVDGIVIKSIHNQTKLSVITIVFREIDNSATHKFRGKFPLSQFIDRISQKKIEIKTQDKPKVDFIDLLSKEYKLNISGDIRCCASQKKEFFNSELRLYYLMGETFNSLDMEAKIVSTSLNNDASFNHAIYDSSDIYISNNVVLRIDKRSDKKRKEYPQMESDTTFLFIMELLAFKDSSVSRTNKKLLQGIDKGPENTGHSLKMLDSITSEFGKTMMFWDMNIFKYTTAQKLSNSIQKEFLIREKFDLYYKNQYFFEHQVNIKQGISQENENKLLFYVALILFIYESIYLFQDIYVSIISDEINHRIAVSSSLSVATTLFLVLFIKIIVNKKILKQ